jgi:hypothetical protein
MLLDHPWVWVRAVQEPQRPLGAQEPLLLAGAPARLQRFGIFAVAFLEVRTSRGGLLAMAIHRRRSRGGLTAMPFSRGLLAVVLFAIVPLAVRCSGVALGMADEVGRRYSPDRAHVSAPSRAARLAGSGVGLPVILEQGAPGCHEAVGLWGFQLGEGCEHAFVQDGCQYVVHLSFFRWGGGHHAVDDALGV